MNSVYYTIPRKIRELQFILFRRKFFIIIPYQEKLGNYNYPYDGAYKIPIIPYQEKLGNYNYDRNITATKTIIPYQEKLGNYNKSWLPWVEN